MFIQNLNEIQQHALLSLSNQIVSVDGNIDEREIAMLNTLRSRCNSTLNNDIHVKPEQLRGMFETKIQKTSFMLELIGMAFADHDYGSEEKLFLSEIANILDISEVQLEDFENWVQRQFILVQEANRFMEE